MKQRHLFVSPPTSSTTATFENISIVYFFIDEQHTPFKIYNSNFFFFFFLEMNKLKIKIYINMYITNRIKQVFIRNSD